MKDLNDNLDLTNLEVLHGTEIPHDLISNAGSIGVKIAEGHVTACLPLVCA